MKNAAGFENAAGFSKSHQFHDKKGDLAVYKHGKVHKFCFDCCLMKEAIKSNQEAHY